MHALSSAHPLRDVARLEHSALVRVRGMVPGRSCPLHVLRTEVVAICLPLCQAKLQTHHDVLRLPSAQLYVHQVLRHSVSADPHPRMLPQRLGAAPNDTQVYTTRLTTKAEREGTVLLDRRSHAPKARSRCHLRRAAAVRARRWQVRIPCSLLRHLYAMSHPAFAHVRLGRVRMPQ